MTEITISEAHARDRPAEAALVLLVEIEARLERNALDRGADGLAADLERIAGKPDMAHRAGARELHRAGSAAVIENTARATRTVKALECEYLAGHEPAGFIGIHRLPGDCRHGHRGGKNGPQHKTRNHAVTPTN